MRLDELSDRELTLLRRRDIGFVFQSYNLLPVLSAEENITLPVTIGGAEPDREWLDTLIRTMGLEDRREHRPAELSGGEQQRVAVARALIDAADRDLRRRAHWQPRLRGQPRDPEAPSPRRRRARQTIVMVTHDAGAAATADRVLFLADGQHRRPSTSTWRSRSILDHLKSLQ